MESEEKLLERRKNVSRIVRKQIGAEVKKALAKAKRDQEKGFM